MRTILLTQKQNFDTACTFLPLKTAEFTRFSPKTRFRFNQFSNYRAECGVGVEASKRQGSGRLLKRPSHRFSRRKFTPKLLKALLGLFQDRHTVAGEDHVEVEHE